MSRPSIPRRNLRVELEKDFSRRFFSELFRKYPTKSLVERYRISRCMLYSYRNGRTTSIPEALLNDFSALLGVPKREIKRNTVRVINYADAVSETLALGRNKRRSNIEKAKSEVAAIGDIIGRNFIDAEKWFFSYKKLSETGPRKIDAMRIGGRISLSYDGYSNGAKKRFSVNLPRKIPLDYNFQYFFGLWCGDRAGGGRVGVLNKQEELVRFTDSYLRRLHQRPTFVLLQADDSDETPPFDVDIDEIVKVKNMGGKYVVSVFSVNGVLKSLFDLLHENLDYVLRKLPDKNLFFAGLFDAEGNVLLEDGVFRWSCCNARNVKIYKKHLSELGLFDAYDGSNLVTKNINAFASLIFPHIKHKAKVNDSGMLISGKGKLNGKLVHALIAVRDNPGCTCVQLSSATGIRRLYPKLRLLNRLDYIYHLEYPRRFYMTRKGASEVNGHAHPD